MSFNFNISVLVLAAGRSARFYPNHKALPGPWGASLLRRAFEVFSLIGLTAPSVVVGYRALEVGEEVNKLGGRIIENINYDRGMMCSVVEGIKSLDSSVEGVLVFPLDTCFVNAASLLSLIAFWVEKGFEAPNIVAIPAFKQRLGRPPLIGSSLLPKIQNYNGPDGLRGALASLAYNPALAQSIVSGLSPQGEWSDLVTRRINLADPMVLCEIDSPNDLMMALEQPKIVPLNPTPWEAMTLLRLVAAPEIKKKHSISVAVGALRLALTLGHGRDEMAFIGGLCHDLDRSQPKHDLKALARLSAIGWSNLAAVVGAHTELPQELLNYIGYHQQISDRHFEDAQAYRNLANDVVEAALCVHLADKYFLGTTPVSLQERFQPFSELQDSKSLEILKGRLEAVSQLEHWFQQRIGYHPAKVVLTPSQHPFEDMVKDLASEVGFKLEDIF